MSTQLRTEAIDRVLEALSPALTAEIERVLAEARQQLEADFEKRLQVAIRDAQESTRVTADAERLRAVELATAETRETVRKQVTDELTSDFNRRFDEVSERAGKHEKDLQKSQSELQKLQHNLQKAENDTQKVQGEWNAERDRLQQQVDQWHVFAEAQRQLTEATSQPEILVRWLKLAEPFADSLALYTAKADGLALWKSRGSAVFPQVISQQTTDPESYFKPIVVRDKTIAAVCAAQSYRVEALDFLTTTLERAIELFGLRLRVK